MPDDRIRRTAARQCLASSLGLDSEAESFSNKSNWLGFEGVPDPLVGPKKSLSRRFRRLGWNLHLGSGEESKNSHALSHSRSRVAAAVSESRRPSE